MFKILNCRLLQNVALIICLASPRISSALPLSEHASNELILKFVSVDTNNLTEIINLSKSKKAVKIENLMNPSISLDLKKNITRADINNFIRSVKDNALSINDKASDSRKQRIVSDAKAPLKFNFLLNFDKDVKVEQLQGMYAGYSYIREVSFNDIVKVKALPNDYYIDSNQDGRLDTISQTGKILGQAYMDIDAYMQKAQTGKGIVVAVLDDGFAEMNRPTFDINIPDSQAVLYNPELSDSYWRNSGEIADDGIDNDRNGWVDDAYIGANVVAVSGCADKNINCTKKYKSLPWSGFADFHGITVSSVIASKANNQIGIAGIAPGVTIMGIKVLDGSSAKSKDSKGNINPAYQENNVSNLVKGIIYAVANGADVINLSIGLTLDKTDLSERQTIQDAINTASNNGVIVVASAGNDAVDGIDLFPAAADKVIAVASSKTGGTLDTSFSNFGTSVELVAPGRDVGVMYPQHTVSGIRYGNPYDSRYLTTEGYFSTASGTSFSSPIVAATIALMLEKNSSLSRVQILNILQQTSTPLVGPTKGIQSGIVNVARALNAVPTKVSNIAIRKNILNQFDVNNDGMVSPMDALTVINALNGIPLISTFYYDVNGDGNITPVDALLVINKLNQNR